MKEIDRNSLPTGLQALLASAEKVMGNAYEPYSHYKVGAAVIGRFGDDICVGCNVENAAYTGSHAETGAIAQLVANGEKEIHAIAIATKDGGAPCGDCRQRIWELSGGNVDLQIFLIDEEGKVMESSIGELLPFAFNLNF